jgi:hypothetical protein
MSLIASISVSSPTLRVVTVMDEDIAARWQQNRCETRRLLKNTETRWSECDILSLSNASTCSSALCYVRSDSINSKLLVFGLLQSLGMLIVKTYCGIQTYGQISRRGGLLLLRNK